jgi:hypothetical protein
MTAVKDILVACAPGAMALLIEYARHRREVAAKHQEKWEQKIADAKAHKYDTKVGK